MIKLYNNIILNILFDIYIYNELNNIIYKILNILFNIYILTNR